MTISDLDVFFEKILSPVISSGPRPCFEGCSAARRGVRGPEDAVRPRNGGGTLKISAAAGVGSGARGGGGRAARVQVRRGGQSGDERRVDRDLIVAGTAVSRRVFKE